MEAYYGRIGEPEFPLMADEDDVLPSATPMSGLAHPEVCALAPDMTIISCYAGHGSHLTALDDIRAHAGL